MVCALVCSLSFAYTFDNWKSYRKMCNYMKFRSNFTLKFITWCVCAWALNGNFVAKIDNTEHKLHHYPWYEMYISWCHKFTWLRFTAVYEHKKPTTTKNCNHCTFYIICWVVNSIQKYIKWDTRSFGCIQTISFIEDRSELRKLCPFCCWLFFFRPIDFFLMDTYRERIYCMVDDIIYFERFDKNNACS